MKRGNVTLRRKATLARLAQQRAKWVEKGNDQQVERIDAEMAVLKARGA